MADNPMFAFEHSYIDTALEGRSYGQTALADVDGDGRPEFITGRSGGDIYWYDYHAPGRWTRHLLGTASPSDVGGAALDVDGDGWIDFVAGGAWYRDPGRPADRPFERIVFDPDLRGVHDLAVGDLNGDGRPEVVTLSDKNNLRWYGIPADPRQPWVKHDIGPAVHAGLALGDIDGDGDLDVVRTDVWFENVRGDGSEWVSHPIGPNTPPPPDFRPAFAFNATKAVVCDMNGDGRNDIVFTDAEIPGGKVWWMENLDGKGTRWLRHDIPNGDAVRRGAYHSLWVGDLDGDGDMDVFSCEMEGVPGANPPRWYVWENLDGKGGAWREHVILDANLGGHEAVVGDVDGDGRLDLCSKLWSPRKDNANGGRMHVDFLRNVSGAAAEAVPTATQALHVPGRDWEEVTPESQGVDGPKLREAVELLARTVGSDGAREFVIVRHGRLIWRGDASDRRHGVWSMTKSFTSTALGLLIVDGKCTLDTRAADVLPALREHYPEVTLRHLATMTSGYRAVGDEPAGTYRHGPSRTPFAPGPEPLFVPPGSQYAYWDSAMNLFALILTRIAGEPLEELLRRRVAEPIGMSGWDWGEYATVDALVVNGGSGNADKHVVLSALEMARFGLLFLNRGAWQGRPVIPRWWVDAATRVQVPAAVPWAQPESEIDGRGLYGYNWWCNGIGADGRRKFPGAPPGTFWASGHNNNKCFVVPEWDMVIVRLGLDGKARDEVWDAFLAKVGEAIRTPPQSGPSGRQPGELTVEAIGTRFTPDPGRVVIQQPYADAGGSTSVRNAAPDHLEWKSNGYFQRNRDLGQVFTAERDFALAALVLRTGPSDAAVLAGTPGAPLFVQFFEVEGLPRIDDNGTPPGTRAKHGFSGNHRCDDVLRGVTYRPLRVVRGGVFPSLPPSRDAQGNATGSREACGVYLRWCLAPTARLACRAGARYAFMVGIEEPAAACGFTLANANAAGVDAPPALGDRHDRYPGGWGLRREGDGTLPPTMVPGAAPPADAGLVDRLRAEALFPAGTARFLLPPTTDGYPDVDTYRDLEFYLETEDPGQSTEGRP